MHAPKLAAAQWWAANAGLGIMAVGFTLRARGSLDVATVTIATGGTLAAGRLRVRPQYLANDRRPITGAPRRARDAAHGRRGRAAGPDRASLTREPDVPATPRTR